MTDPQCPMLLSQAMDVLGLPYRLAKGLPPAANGGDHLRRVDMAGVGRMLAGPLSERAERVCLTCGKAFEVSPKNAKQRYCEPACRPSFRQGATCSASKMQEGA